MIGHPGTWVDASIGDLLDGIKAGKNLKCDERPPTKSELGVVKVSAVTWGSFDPCQSKTLPHGYVPAPGTRVEAGDLLFSRANTVELVGAAVIVDMAPGNLFLSDKVLRLGIPSDLRAWVLRFLRCAEGRKALADASTGNQLSMRNISQAALSNIRLPLPPLPEQRRIVAKLDRLSAWSRAAREHLDRVAKLAARAKQAVLAAAFRGGTDGGMEG